MRKNNASNVYNIIIIMVIPSKTDRAENELDNLAVSVCE